jgi:hypothetical protein
MMLREDGYELFRRAVVERDANAWSEIALSYRAMMIGWARRSQAAELSGEQCEDLADEALARAWKALSPGRFAELPTLAALLGYLRTCGAPAASDAARARMATTAMPDWRAADRGTPIDLEVIERMSRAELWQLALHVATSDAERVVLFDRFVLGLPPRAIQHRHPVVFPDVRKVYETVRNLCDRLRRNQDLRRIVGEHLAA